MSHELDFPGVLPAATQGAGTIVVTHGLNISPAAMRAIGNEFSIRGWTVLYTCLSGHAGDHVHANADLWKQDLRGVLERAAQFPKPLWMLGYSLGGLLSTLVATEQNAPQIDRLLLLAPAIGLRPWVRIAQPLARMLPTWLPLRSGVPRRYRASAVVNPGWYQALFVLDQELGVRSKSGTPSSIPVRVFISGKDEFISLQELSGWSHKGYFKDITLTEIKAHSGDWFIPHHLILDEGCFGVGKWQEFIAHLVD